MFDDSLIESCGQFASAGRRWITAGSVCLQCLVAAGIVAVPLLRPEALSFRVLSPAVVVPVVQKPPVVVVKRTAVASSASLSVPQVVQVATRAAILNTLRPVDAGEPSIADPGPMRALAGNGGGGDLLGGTAVGGGRRVVAAAAAAVGPTRISAGVSAGMLLGEIRPVYPRIAIAARVEGVVVVEATISKTGGIESARVVSGPAMLAGAAIEAVRAARYRPYLLNGQATEVQTTVTVNFRLGGG